MINKGGICMEGPKFRELSIKEMDAILPNLQVLLLLLLQIFFIFSFFVFFLIDY